MVDGANGPGVVPQEFLALKAQSREVVPEPGHRVWENVEAAPHLPLLVSFRHTIASLPVWIGSEIPCAWPLSSCPQFCGRHEAKSKPIVFRWSIQ